MDIIGHHQRLGWDGWFWGDGMEEISLTVCSPGVPPFQLLLPPPEPGLSSGKV